MKQVGLLPSQIGVIKSGGKFMSFIIEPVIGTIADKTGRSKIVAVFSVLAASALVFSLFFVPPVTSTAASERDLAEPDNRDTQSWFSVTFWLFFWILFIANGVQFSTVFQVRAATYQIIKKNGRGEFGRQRAFGSAGFALFGLLSGVAMDTITNRTSPENPGNRTSPDIPGNKSDYSVAFYMYLTFMALSVASLLVMKEWNIKPSPGLLKGMGRLFSQPHLIIVLFAVLLLGVYDGASGTFLFLHLKDLGARQTVLGTYVVVKTVSEIPAFVISTWIIKKIGYPAVLGGGFLAFGLRFLLYSFVSNPWWAVAIDTLNGYQAVTWAAATSYASISAPDDLQTVIQGIVATTFHGLGHTLGNLVGGPIFQHYGAVVLFRSVAVSCLIGLLLFCLLYGCFGRKENPTERHSDTGKENERQRKPTLVPAMDVTESAAPRPGAFLSGGSVTNGAGEHIGLLRLVRPQDQDTAGRMEALISH
ncbi:major facilitator superfamily domain-containing protein 6-like [Branchiostoma lanceolatum]|uniref:major facilitator superfamily domain-containing protein 6-like n=1 Tax=Branchiostoma lanceolatum TaxID=7740 RepID=UPI0034558FF8